MELLRYYGKANLYNQLKEWHAPRFPINGNTLINKGAPKGQQLGVVMNELKMIWSANRFSMSENELLEHLPGVLNKLGLKSSN